RDVLGEVVLACGVLYGVAWERTTVADEVAEERELVRRHRRLLRLPEATGEREVLAFRERVERLPALDGEELVIGRRADRAAEAGGEAEDGLRAGLPGAADLGHLQLQRRRVQRPDVEAALWMHRRQLPDGHAAAGIGEGDERVGREAAGLAEVGELGPLVAAARLDGARELGERDDGDVELLGEPLEGAADLGDLLLAVGALALDRPVHELEVVHDDQPDVVLGLEAAALRAELEDAEAGRVVDEDGGLGEAAG